jgi:RNA polymerase sigma-70 factor (ECF subfamily)
LDAGKSGPCSLFWPPSQTCRDQIIAAKRKKARHEPADFWARKDEDVRLMLRFRAGDELAFQELVRRNTHKVHALVYRFLGGAGSADDVTQEVFLRIFRTAHRYVPAAKFSTWLYRIVANLSFNVIRARQRSQEYQFTQPTDGEGESLEPTILDERSRRPGDKLSREELREQIARAIGALPENQQIAMILHQYEYKNYEDIAEVLNCSTMAVKSLLSRARQNLRRAMRRYLKD